MKTFITRLKGVVNNDTLKKIGELRVKVSKMSNPTGENRVIILNTQKPLTITVNGDGYITDSTLSENKGKILSIPVGSSTFYVSNGDYTLSIPNKYYLTSFCSAKEQTFNRNDVQMELDDFKFCKLMTILKLNNSKVSGDIASLKDLSALASLNISDTQVSGDIASLKGLSTLASLNISNTQVSGDIASLKDLSALASLNISNTQVSGDIASLKGLSALASLDITSTQVSGDIASLKDLSTLASLNISNTQVSGDIASLKGLSALASLNISNLNNLSGDLGKLPDSLLYVGGINNSIFTWTDTSRRYILACEKLHCNNIDKMLQDMSKLEAKFKNQWAKSINLVGSYTAASNAAIETLQSKGYTVSITPA
jgi:biotin operon repressor